MTIELRIDSFADANTIRRIEGVLREMMAEKGFTNADVKHTITSVAGGPKLVNVTFSIGEGPKLKIREIDFVGPDLDGCVEGKYVDSGWKGQARTARANYDRGVLATRRAHDLDDGPIWAVPAPALAWIVEPR